MHTPYAAEVPQIWITHRKVARALTRAGTPRWDKHDLHSLRLALACAGFGRLALEEIQDVLE